MRTKTLALLLLLIITYTFFCCQQSNSSNPNYCPRGNNTSSPNIACPIINGSFIDLRDNKTYATVNICGQTWMAENLAYNLPDTTYITIDTLNNDTILVQSSSEFVNGSYWSAHTYNYFGAKLACPNGWHLPTINEWNELLLNIGMNPLDTLYERFIACPLASMLKSTTGWNGRGTNTTNFNALGPNYETYWAKGSKDFIFSLGKKYRLTAYNIRLSIARDEIELHYGEEYSNAEVSSCRCVKN